MGRIGISEYQVFQAADQLSADGQQPTVDTVRVELGNTGSRSTINKYLKLWRERQAHRDAAGANLSGHLRQVITEQAELLLSALETESAAKLQAKTQEFEDTVRALQEKHQALEQAHEQSQTAIKSLQEANEQQALELLRRQSELVDMREQYHSHREALAKEIGRREMLISTVNDRDNQLAAIQKELKTSQSRNEILSESAVGKAAALQQLQQRERDQRALLKGQSNEIKRLNRELGTVRTLNEKERAQLTQTLAKLVGKTKDKPVRKKA